MTINQGIWLQLIDKKSLCELERKEILKWKF